MILLLWTPYPRPNGARLRRRSTELPPRRPFRRPDDDELFVAIL